MSFNFYNLNQRICKFKIPKIQSANTFNEMRIGWVQRFLNKWPGKKTLGMYRFLPMFFILGASLEYSMINWQVGEVNFYNTFKRRQAHEIVEDKIKKYAAS